MIFLHGLRAGFALREISPVATRITVELKRASQHAQTELLCALARALERMIEHYVCWALAGARWVNPQDFANGKCCDRIP